MLSEKIFAKQNSLLSSSMKLAPDVTLRMHRTLSYQILQVFFKNLKKYESRMVQDLAAKIHAGSKCDVRSSGYAPELCLNRLSHIDYRRCSNVFFSDKENAVSLHIAAILCVVGNLIWCPITCIYM